MYKPDGVMAKKIVARLYAQTAKDIQNNTVPQKKSGKKVGWKETPEEEMNRNIQMGIVRPKTGSLKNIRFETEEEANAWGNQYRQSLENPNRELSTA